MKNEIIKFGTFIGFAAPMVMVVSCSSKVINTYDEKYNYSKVFNWENIENNNWDKYDKIFKDLQSHPSYQSAKYAENEYILEKDRTKIIEVAHRVLNNKKIFHDVIEITDTHKTSPTKSYTDFFMQLYPKGTSIDMLLPKDGITFPQEISKFPGIENFDGASNFTSYTLAEGGNINMEFLVKNGKVINLGASNVTANKGTPGFIPMTFFKRPILAVYNDNSFEILDDVNIYDKDLATLHLQVNGNNPVVASEWRNIPAFDYHPDVDALYANPKNINWNLPEQEITTNMQDGDMKVITGTFKEQLAEIDFDSSQYAGITGYEILADETTNGSTQMVDSQNLFFSDVTRILQAPFEGKIVRKLTSGKFKTLPGEALLLVKNGESLNVGDHVSATLDLGKNNIATKLKDAKFASSIIGYGNGIMYVGEEPESEYHDYNGTPLNKGNFIKGSSFYTNAGHLIHDGKVLHLPAFNPLSNSFSADSPPRQYFVEMKNGDFGTITFKRNISSMHFSQVQEILGLLDIKEALALDGGGSAQQYIRNNGEMLPFAKSIDVEGYRAMETALVFGGKDE